MSIARVKVKEPKDDEPEEAPPAAEPSAEPTEPEPAPTGAPAAKPAPEKKAKKLDEGIVERLSTPLRDLRTQEDQSLKDWIDSIGEQGSFRVVLSREQPTSVRDPRSGRDVNTSGHLKTYSHSIDEEFIQQNWGGGTYYLKVMKKTATGYQFQQGFHRTVTIAGSPDLTNLPGGVPGPAASQIAAAAESPSVVTQAFGVLKEQIARQDAAARPTMDPSITLMIEQANRREEARERESARREEAHRAEMAALRAEMREGQNAKPAADPLKDKMLSNMLDGQSGHVTALTQRHESELRQVKEGHIQEVRRLEDRHDRTVQEMRQSHEINLASLKGSFEREIAAIRQSQEVALASTKASYDVQVRTLDGEIKRLERDNTKLDKEVVDLRAKKEKSLPEQIKEITALKELMGTDESGSGWADKIAEIATNPAIIEGASRMFGSQTPPAQAQAQRAAQAAPSAQFVRDPKTKKVYANTPQGLVPLKPKPKVMTQEDGTQVELPEIDPEQVKQIIGLMERAFTGNQDPVIVAQSSRPHIPPDILAWIQQNDSPQTSGVDLFLSKVAKLPGTSPLAASMRGREWVRALGKALVNG
jgi:hypothetical protein